MIDRYPFDAVAQRGRDLEVLHNSLAMDTDAIVPWTQAELFHPDSNKKDVVRFARVAINGAISRLTTSPEDIKKIDRILRYDKTLGRFS